MSAALVSAFLFLWPAPPPPPPPRFGILPGEAVPEVILPDPKPPKKDRP